MVLADDTAQMSDTSRKLLKISSSKIDTPADITSTKRPRASPPHFMTPTFASRRSEVERFQSQATTPVSIQSIKVDGGQSLVRSAAQRVGLRATGKMPHGEKDGAMKHSDGVLLSDSHSAPSSSSRLQSPLATAESLKDINDASLDDKPLPDLPPHYLNTSSPHGSSASLVEPTDKPLPTFASNSFDLEESAVLLPDLPASSDTLQHVLCQTGKALRQQMTTGDRYPKLGDTTIQKSLDRKQVTSRYASTPQLGQEGAPAPTPQKLRGASEALLAANRLSDPFGDDAEASDPFNTNKELPCVEHLTTGSARIDSPFDTLMTVATPRQTKTSLLRARLSVGQLSSRSKTSSPPLKGRTSKVSLRSNAYDGSLAKCHAPAQFVGGSRRPGLPPRPGSRNSTGNAAGRSVSAASNRLPGIQPRDSLPLSSSRIASNSIPQPVANGQVQPRKSSIPVPSNIALKARSASSSGPSSALELVQNSHRSTTSIRNTVVLTEDGSHVQCVTGTGVADAGSTTNNPSVNNVADVKQAESLAVIEESPQHVHALKEVSVNATKYGASLKISADAERLIMGSPEANTSDKENASYGKRPKGLFQRAAKSVYKQPTPLVSPVSTTDRRLNRPHSSHGKLQTGTRHGVTRLDTPRNKKARSVDLSSRLSWTSNATPNSKGTNLDGYRVSGASSNNAPFFDALDITASSTGDGFSTPLEQEEEPIITDQAAWIPSTEERIHGTLNDVQQTPSGLSQFTSDKNSAKNASSQKQKMTPKRSLTAFSADVKHQNPQATGTLEHVSGQQVQTPMNCNSKTPSSAGSYPPRSSSRIAHPSFTTLVSSRSSLTPEKALPAPPQEESHLEKIQNNLGSLRGHGSARIDITDYGHKSATQIRSSLVRTSLKSSSSQTVSKKPFANFRNLFNKRVSTPDSFKSESDKIYTSNKARDTKKPEFRSGKASVAVTESPFPPIDSVPLIYRPTLASRNRGKPSSRNSIASTPPTPASMSSTTTLAMDLLVAARDEESPPRKERLLQISKIMVNAITLARDAEKAAEDAKLAAKKADLAREVCEGLVRDAGCLIREWRTDPAG